MKWNTTTPKNSYRTYEGGKAYEHSLEDEWSNFLFSSYLDNSYYESAEEQTNRYIDLTTKIIDKYGPEVAGKIAQFSRNVLGLRSISQLTMALLDTYIFDGKRKVFRDYFHRPDDVAEILAAIELLGNHWSHAFVRGAGDYLSTLNEYQLGKYKMLGKKYNLYDCINITHPKSKAITAFKHGEIQAPDTWEVKISASKTQEDRNQEWLRLVREGRLGYLALLRNLRNIVQAGITNEDIREYLVPQLVNKQAIARSLVYPYQIYNAYLALYNDDYLNSILTMALEDAFIISCGNMPDLPNSCVILDVSGSMDCQVSTKSNMTIKQLGACFAAALVLSQDNCDFVKFGNFAIKKTFLRTNSPFSVIKQMCANDSCGYGTCLGSAFQVLNRWYDNIFIISDMQTMDVNDYSWSNSRSYYYTPNTSYSTQKAYTDYIARYMKNGKSAFPDIYSFDLGGYRGTPMAPNDKVHMITTLNDKVFKFIEIQKTGKNLLQYIIENY